MGDLAECPLSRDVFALLVDFLDLRSLSRLNQSGLRLASEILGSESAESLIWEPRFHQEFERLIEEDEPIKLRRFWQCLSKPAFASVIFSECQPPSSMIKWSNKDRIEYMSSIINGELENPSEMEGYFGTRMMSEMDLFSRQGHIILAKEHWEQLYSEYRQGLPSKEQCELIDLKFSSNTGELYPSEGVDESFADTLLSRLLFKDQKKQTKGGIPFAYLFPSFKDGFIDMTNITICIIIPSSLEQSLYRGMNHFELHLELPLDYPIQPPKITQCTPKVRHLARFIGDDPCAWCLSYLKDRWFSANWTFSIALWFLRSFSVPNIFEVDFIFDFNPDTDPELYQAYVKDHGSDSEYAKLIRDSLK